MPIFHHSINNVMKSLAECPEERLLCISNNDWLPSLYLSIESYIAEIRETEELLSVERRNRMIMSCQMIHIKKRDHFLVFIEPKRSWKWIESLFNECLEEGRVAWQKLKLAIDCSLLSLEPVLADFTFAGISLLWMCIKFPDFNRYITYRLDWVRCKKRLEKYAKHWKPNHNCYGTSSGAFKLFESVEITALFILNRFLSVYDTALIGFWFS